MAYREGGRVQLTADAIEVAGRCWFVSDVSTLDEAGLKGFDTSIWYGVFTPKSTAVPVRKILADARLGRCLLPPDGEANARCWEVRSVPCVDGSELARAFFT